MLLVHPEAIDPLSLSFLSVGSLIERMGIQVPAVGGYAADLGIVELEDLGDLTLQQFLTKATPDERAGRYREAVAIIVTMQHQGRELESNEFVPFRLAFDVDKLMSELEFGRPAAHQPPRGAQTACGRVVSRASRLLSP